MVFEWISQWFGARERPSVYQRAVPIEELGTLFEAANDGRGNESRAYYAIMPTGKLPAIIAALEADGYTAAKLVGFGDHAIVVETSPGKLLRFRGPKTEEPNTWDPPDIDQMIASHYNREVEGCRIVGVDKIQSLAHAVRDGDISKEDADLIVEHMRVAAAKNVPPCYFYDWKNSKGTKYEQIGLLPSDNTPVFIDMGCVMYAQDCLNHLNKPGDEQQRHAIEEEIEKLKQTKLPLPDTGWDGSWRNASGERKTEQFAKSRNPQGRRLNG